MGTYAINRNQPVVDFGKDSEIFLVPRPPNSKTSLDLQSGDSSPEKTVHTQKSQIWDKVKDLEKD